MPATSDTFNDIGFLAQDLVGWTKMVRAEFSEQFELADDMNRLAMRVMFAIPVEEIDDSRAFAAATFGRAVQSFQTTILLAERGALAEARALVRLCCEGVIAVAGLLTVPGTCDKFREDNARHQRAVANSMLQAPGDYSLTTGQVERMQEVVAAVDAEYPNGTTSIKWEPLAKASDTHSLYQIAYRLTSGDGAHVTVGSMSRNVIDGDDGTLGFRFHPDKSDLAETLFTATASLIQLLGFAVERMGVVSFREEVEAMSKRWQSIGHPNDRQALQACGPKP